MTNADHIRQMTDEELAENIMCPYDAEIFGCKYEDEPNCFKCCLDWLHQKYRE